MKTPFGVAQPQILFGEFRERGNEELAKLRNYVARPAEQKQQRTWSGPEVVSMVGISEAKLKKLGFDSTAHYELNAINDLREAAGTLYHRPQGSHSLIVTVMNFKGGVGKSTTTIQLAQYCAQEGLRALVIDLDPQASTTMNLTTLIPDLELDYEHVLNEALLEDPTQLRYLIRETYFPNVFIIPSNLLLQDLDLALPNPTLNNEDKIDIPAAMRLAAGLEDIREDFDVILIDCPPNMAALSTNAIIAANAMLIPLPPLAMDRASFVMLCSSLEELFKTIDKPLDYLRILVSKHGGTKSSREQEARIRAVYGGYVNEHPMYISTEIEKAKAMLSSIYDQVGPQDRRETYERALQISNLVNKEILDGFKCVWEEQANG